MSISATAAREAARQPGGRFGPQVRASADLQLLEPGADSQATFAALIEAGQHTIAVPGEVEALVIIEDPSGPDARLLVPFDVDGLADSVTGGRSGYRGALKPQLLHAARVAAQQSLGDEDLTVVDRDGQTWLSLPFDAEMDETPQERASELIEEYELGDQQLIDACSESFHEYVSDPN